MFSDGTNLLDHLAFAVSVYRVYNAICATAVLSVSLSVTHLQGVSSTQSSNFLRCLVIPSFSFSLTKHQSKIPMESVSVNCSLGETATVLDTYDPFKLVVT